MSGVIVLMGLVAAGPGFGHHHGDAGRPVRELFAPVSWAGQWEFRIEYRNRETGQLIATDQATEVICPGDRLGLSAYVGRRRPHGHGRHSEENGLQASCRGAAQDDVLEVTCTSRLVLGDCRVDFQSEVHALRQMDAITGAGEWRVTETEGDCAPLLEDASLGEVLEITGVRRSPDPGACLDPPASLVEKLLSQPDLIRLLPPPIEDLSARSKGRTVHLSWTAVPQAAAYKIYRALPDEPFELLARRTDRHARFRDHRLRGGRTYRYVVRWLDALGRESPVSNQVSATLAAEQER